MPNDGWDQVRPLFFELAELPPEDRAVRLRALTEDDPELRVQLERLLAAHDRTGELLGPFEELISEPSFEPAPATPTGAAGRAVSDPHGLLGRTVSHYEVVALMGAGGMGVLYRATDIRLGRAVALKFLPPQWSLDAAFKRRFLREARAAAALDHPNVCAIYEVGETEEGQLFIAMAFYGGETVKDKVGRGPLAVEEALGLARQAAGGLAAAHRAGLVHRDIKPANLMVTDEGVLKILDFGLAKTGESALTESGTRLGTPAYMSPEQADGREVDARTDLWSLGVVLYEMLTGRRPFEAPTDHAVIYAILHRRPAPLSDHATPDLERVVATCLAKDPELRYAGVAQLADALESVSRAGVLGRSTGLRARWRRLRSARLLVGAAALALLAAGAVIGVRHVLGPGWASMDVVVLPLVNVGGDPARQPFVDGLLHTATNVLAAMERFEGRVSVVPAQDILEAGPVTTAAAGEKFRVAFAIIGAVQHAADRVILDFGLVDTREGRQRRARRLELPLARLAELPDSMVQAFTELLELDLEVGAGRVITAGGTTTPGAYDLYTEGRGHLLRYDDEREVDRAIQLLREAIAEDSMYVLAHAALGEAYWRKYRATRDPTWVDKAVHYGRRAVAMDEDLASVQVTLGMIYNGTGRYAEAAGAFRRALELHPGNAFAHRELAIAYYFQDSLDLAVTHLERAIALRANYGDFHRSLGFMYHVQGRHEAAKVPYRRATELAPDNPWNFNDLAAQYELLGQYDEASRWYLEATRADPANREAAAYAYGNLGGIQYRLRNFSESVRLFEEAYRADSMNAEAWINLPDAYFWAGMTAKARSVLRRIIELEQRALEINPNDVAALNRLAKGYAMTGQPGPARETLERLETLEPVDPRVLFGMTWSLEYVGDRERAVEYLERALQNGLTLPAIEFHAVSLENLREDPRYQALVRRYLGEARRRPAPAR